MFRRLCFGLLFAIVAFVLAAPLSYFLILELSPNMYDRSVEAAMTSAFFSGPAGALLGFIGGCIFGGRRRVAPGMAEDRTKPTDASVES